ncbi:MAG: hypothetical protein Q8O52_11510 [Sulfuritalea sp.]|nr:hypothetical protein [Sulfuritalea sp.]
MTIAEPIARFAGSLPESPTRSLSQRRLLSKLRRMSGEPILHPLAGAFVSG